MEGKWGTGRELSTGGGGRSGEAAGRGARSALDWARVLLAMGLPRKKSSPWPMRSCPSSTVSGGGEAEPVLKSSRSLERCEGMSFPKHVS